jgi:hypothetical protein
MFFMSRFVRESGAKSKKSEKKVISVYFGMVEITHIHAKTRSAMPAQAGIVRP